MLLYLMRHGEALPVGAGIPEDALRPLSAQGLVQVRRVAEGLKRQAPSLEAVISSPLIRARETAGIVAEVLGVSRLETSASLSPSSSPAGLRALLAPPDPIPGMLWVGHHPDVTVWTSFLTGLDSSVCPLFGTASVAALRFDPPGKKAEFLWFQTSEQLAQR